MRDFYRLYKELVMYKNEYRNLDVPRMYMSGIYPLGVIVKKVRKGLYRLSEEEINKLNRIGFVWEDNYTAQNGYSTETICELLENFISKYGHCNIPFRYRTEEGIHLGRLLDYIDKGNRRISDNNRKKLKAYNYNVVRNTRIKRVWTFEKFYDYMVEFKNKYHHCNVKQNYVTEDGVRLGIDVYYLKIGKINVTPAQRQKLEELGFDFSLKHKIYKFDDLFDLIVKYKQEYGHCAISSTYKTEDGVPLGAKVYAIRTGARKLNDEQRNRLKSIGFF